MMMATVQLWEDKEDRKTARRLIRTDAVLKDAMAKAGVEANALLFFTLRAENLRGIGGVAATKS